MIKTTDEIKTMKWDIHETDGTAAQDEDNMAAHQTVTRRSSSCTECRKDKTKCNHPLGQKKCERCTKLSLFRGVDVQCIPHESRQGRRTDLANRRMSKGDKTDEAATKAEVNMTHQTVTRRSKRKRGT